MTVTVDDGVNPAVMETFELVVRRPTTRPPATSPTTPPVTPPSDDDGPDGAGGGVAPLPPVEVVPDEEGQPEAEVVHPDRETTVQAPDETVSVTFPSRSTTRTVQARVDSTEESELEMPPRGTVLAAVTVEVFDAEGTRLESPRLNNPATVRVELSAARVLELGGLATLQQADQEGRLKLLTPLRAGPALAGDRLPAGYYRRRQGGRHQ